MLTRFRLASNTDRAVVWGTLLALAVLAVLDNWYSLLSVSACGYAFFAFTGWHRVRRHRTWLVPLILGLIATGGISHRESDPSKILRASVACCCTAAFVYELVILRKSSRKPTSSETLGGVTSDSTALGAGVIAVESTAGDSGNLHIGIGPLGGNSQVKRHEVYENDTQAISSGGEPLTAEESSGDWIGIANDPSDDDDDDDISGIVQLQSLQQSLPDRLEASGAFDRETMQVIRAACQESESLEEQMADCVRRNALTKFQLECIRNQSESSLKVGQYTVRSIIGRGAMGVVYRAIDRTRGREVALKLFRNPEERLARIRREMAVLEELAHPNIVIALEVGESEGRLFIAMEIVDGETLASIIKRSGPLAPATALHIILQISVALEQAHARGILHRDIKPGNIMVTRTGDSKLLDLGTSLPPKKLRDFDTVELQGPMIFGTIGFMSPEQAKGLPETDARSDLFSIGATLYYLLTGKLLIEGDDADERLINTRRKTNWRSISASRFPKPLENMLTQLTAPDPAARYQSVAELIPDLRTMVRESGIMPDDRSVHVLVVEPETDQSSLTSHLLDCSNRSLKINVCSSFSAACDEIWLHTESSDLPLIVLLDLDLPKSTQAEIADSISRISSQQVHVVALGQQIDAALREKCLGCGAVDVLAKATISSQSLERVIFTTFGRLPPSHRLTVASREF